VALTSAPSSKTYFTAASHESGALREEFAPQPRPAATISAVTPSVDRVFGSAPFETSSFIAATSVDSAARQKGVAPFLSIHSSLWCVGRNQSAFFNGAFGSAPRSSSSFINSRYGVFDSDVIGFGAQPTCAHWVSITA
jgi:hypothetical protein